MTKRNRKWTETRVYSDENDNETKLTVEFQMVDNGIGSYEFWGAKGNDVRWEAEFVKAWTKNGSEFNVDDDDLIRTWEETAECPDDGEDDYPPDSKDE